MYTRQVTDSMTFLKKALEKKLEVRVLKSTTALPQHKSGAVLMAPAVVLRYSFVLPSEGKEPSQEWIYEEVHFENDRGEADLSGALLKTLEDKKVSLARMSRSGSF
jgi:hypothetical protein